MLFSISLLFLLIYFKIARVHKKEEKLNPLMIMQHILFSLSTVATLAYGALNIEWYIILILSVLFSVIASFLVTAIQLGIFVDGKPIFGLQKLYKFLPLLSLVIILLSALLWIDIA